MTKGSQALPPDPLEDIRQMIAEVRDLLVSQKKVREYYSVDQAAESLGRRPFTVREWCRLRRINAEKRRTGRGRSTEWVISHAELLRIEKEGLLPLRLEH
jgi:hypothetical protein